MCLLSVVMPVYNGGNFLSETMQSILTQTLSDFELIVIDDGSTDSSLQLLKDCAARDSRIRLISRENRGLVPTLNEACQMARAPYIVRMDADDIAHPQRFEKQYAFMEANPELLGSGCQVLLIDADGAPIKAMGTLTSHEAIDADHMAGLGGAIIHPSAIIRREVLERIGYYSDDYSCAEDLDLWLRIAEIGPVANMEDVLLSYRQHPGSIGASSRERQYRSAKAAVQAACRRRNLAFDEGSFAPAKTNPSKQELYRKWGWWGLQAGYRSTAYKYAWRSVFTAPFNMAAWKLLYCTLRGR